MKIRFRLIFEGPTYGWDMFHIIGAWLQKAASVDFYNFGTLSKPALSDLSTVVEAIYSHKKSE